MQGVQSDVAKKQRIEKIVKQSYNQLGQQLTISRKPNIWIDVLKSRCWTNLTILLLYNCRVNDINAKQITNLDWPNLKALGVDDFQQKKFTAIGLTKLLSKQWPKLLSLSLFTSGIGDQGMKMLLKTDKTPVLNRLYVGNSNITDKGLSQVKNQLFKNLMQLNITKNNIGRRGITLFTKNQFPLLEELWISTCYLQDKGIITFSKGKCPNLKRLGISENYIGFNGYDIFSTNNNLRSLQFMGSDEQEFEIGLLSFVSSVWRNKVEFENYFAQDEIVNEIDRVLKDRFNNYSKKEQQSPHMQ